MAPFSIAHEGVSPKLILQPELTHCNTNKQAKNKQRIVKKKKKKKKRKAWLYVLLFHLCFTASTTLLLEGTCSIAGGYRNACLLG